MSQESLVKVAAIVWAAAIFVGVLLGLPTLLSVLDLQINFGLIVSAMAAIGSLTAASVALWVATSDRRERQQERAAAAEAQAKFVIVAIGRYDRGPSGATEYEIRCTNHGALPILDVRVESAKMRGFPRAHSPLSTFVKKLLPAGGADTSFMTSWVDENGEPFPKNRDQQSINVVDIEAFIRFLDANGNQWLRSNTGALERLPLS